jgi:hypothetical protein
MLLHRLLFLIPILIFGCKGKQTEQSSQDKNDSVDVETLVSQSLERDSLIDANQNIWQRRDRLQLKLPKGYYVRSAIIYSDDSLKNGEIVLDNQRLKKPMSNKELFLAIKSQTPIETEETFYGYPYPIDSTEFKKPLLVDSTSTFPVKWLYEIRGVDWESADDWGTWNAFSFHTIQKDRITVVYFTNKDMKDLSIEKYLPILNSIKFIEQ